MIRCLIIDDEPLAINVIKNHLKSFTDFEVGAVCSNAIEAFNLLSSQRFDLIFLDINMPKVNGLEFIRNLENPPNIIITTAYREYAVEGFELDVLDYLVKPISLERFMKALQKVSPPVSETAVVENLELIKEKKAKANYIFVKVDKKMVKIYFDNIFYIESLKDYVSIKTKQGNYTTHYNLLAITKLLPDAKFIRIHRSFTISYDKVEALDGNRVQIQGKLIPIGRNYVKEVKAKILRGFEK